MTRSDAVRRYIRSRMTALDVDVDSVAVFAEATKEEQDATLTAYLLSEKTESLTEDAELDSAKAAEAAKRADLDSAIADILKP